jgi:ATP-dependent Clp protease ATP-binding subunit ClpC
MTDNMSRFTERSRRVFGLAEAEAKRGKASEIDTAHLLIAIIREGDGIAAGVLRNFKLTEEQVVHACLALVRARADQPTARIELSADSKRALQQAVDEARRMQHPSIDTGHLLIALMQMKDSKAHSVIRSLGLDPEAVIEETRRVMNQSPLPPPDPPQKA